MFNSTVYFQVILPSQPRFWFQPLFPILLQPLGGQSMPEDLDRVLIFIWQILQPWKHIRILHVGAVNSSILPFSLGIFSSSSPSPPRLTSSFLTSCLSFSPQLTQTGKEAREKILAVGEVETNQECANQGKESFWLSTKTHFMEGVWLAKCSTSHLSFFRTNKVDVHSWRLQRNKPRNKMNKTSCFFLPPWSLRSWATRPPSNQMFQAQSSFQSLCKSIILHLILDSVTRLLHPAGGQASWEQPANMANIRHETMSWTLCSLI